MRQLLLVLVAAAVLATSAQAVTVQVEFLSSDTAVYGKVIADGTETPNIWVGAFSVKVDGAGPVQAWCADVGQLIPSGHKWTAEKERTTPGALDYPNRRADFGMGVLWANLDAAQGQNSTGLTRAALQLAIWEALYDGTSYDLGNGRFKVSWLSADVKETAKTYLQNWINWGTAKGGYGIINGTLLEAPPPGDGTKSQDLILSPPSNFDPQVIPENTTFLLMGLGLVAVSGALLRPRG